MQGNIIIHQLNRIYARFFGHGLSHDALRFLDGFNAVLFSAAIVGVLIYVLNILAGRWLSVESYAQYQLALSASFFLIIPVIMGLTTSGIQMIAKYHDKKSVVSSLVTLVFFFGVIFVPVMIIFSERLSGLLSINEEVTVSAIFFVIFLAIYSTARAILQGFLRFRHIAILEVVYALISLLVFVVLVRIFGIDDYRAPLMAFGCGYLAFGLACAPAIKAQFSFTSVSRATSIALLRNGVIMVAASISGFLLGNIDRFIINRVIDVESVARYSVYMYSAGILMNVFLQTFITIFFPSMSYFDDLKKIAVNRKINRLSLHLSLPLFLGAFVFITLSLHLFGAKYQLDYRYVSLFASYVVIQFFISTKQWLLASFGRRGILCSTYATIIASAANIILVYFFTVIGGLMGAVTGLIASLVLFILINQMFLSRLLKNSTLRTAEYPNH